MYFHASRAVFNRNCPKTIPSNIESPGFILQAPLHRHLRTVSLCLVSSFVSRRWFSRLSFLHRQFRRSPFLTHPRRSSLPPCPARSLRRPPASAICLPPANPTAPASLTPPWKRIRTSTPPRTPRPPTRRPLLPTSPAAKSHPTPEPSLTASSASCRTIAASPPAPFRRPPASNRASRSPRARP